jgi:regulator of sirC expression with transglutaminase-like and TPR domain
MAAFKNKQWEQALQEYTQAVLLQPDKVAYRGNRAAAALKMNRPSIAVEDGTHPSPPTSPTVRAKLSKP